ncbi:hypothetical protein BT69DRAFT_151207 [Atractiella rhizophila]|nr:hypothetical protein BT69DRAFT_151207 [Atractiella rhizophila]
MFYPRSPTASKSTLSSSPSRPSPSTSSAHHPPAHTQQQAASSIEDDWDASDYRPHIPYPSSHPNASLSAGLGVSAGARGKAKATLSAPPARPHDFSLSSSPPSSASSPTGGSGKKRNVSWGGRMWNAVYSYGSYSSSSTGIGVSPSGSNSAGGGREEESEREKEEEGYVKLRDGASDSFGVGGTSLSYESESEESERGDAGWAGVKKSKGEERGRGRMDGLALDLDEKEGQVDEMEEAMMTLKAKLMEDWEAVMLDPVKILSRLSLPTSANRRDPSLADDYNSPSTASTSLQGDEEVAESESDPTRRRLIKFGRCLGEDNIDLASKARLVWHS